MEIYVEFNPLLPVPPPPLKKRRFKIKISILEDSRRSATSPMKKHRSRCFLGRFRRSFQTKFTWWIALQATTFCKLNCFTRLTILTGKICVLLISVPPFKRSACFYVTISGNFQRFQYFDFETNFLKNEKLFQKTGVPFFRWKH